MPASPLKLVFTDRRGAERSVALTGTFQVGRSKDADMVLDEEGVSRIHSEFHTEGEISEVRDLGSTNGTFVNGSRIQSARLKEGDTVILGRVMLRVESADEQPELSRTTYIGTESVEVAIDASRTSYPPETLDSETSHRHLQALYGILSGISRAHDMDSMLSGVLDTILGTLGLDFGHVLMGPSPDELQAVVSRNVQGGRTPSFSWTVVRRVLRQSEAILANDIQSEPELARSESLVATGALRIACAPIPCDGVGALYVASKGLGSEIGSDDVSFLNAAAHQIGLAAQALNERVNLARENELLRQIAPEPRLIGGSETMERLRSMVTKAAAVDATVLITGESGTGKELVARGIHEGSDRAEGPFVALNCGAVAPSVVQSELFGHEKGAFTGADAQRIGLVELASHGTLFLDEVGELPAEVQVMLLRLLEEKRFYRVGGQREIHADLRFVAATNRDLDAMASEGSFREDLLYRLKVVEVHTPALREHPEDLGELTDHLLGEIARATGRVPKVLSDRAREALEQHDWPGNVRELRNVLERALLLSPGERIEAPDLGLNTLQSRREEGACPLISLSEVEKEHIQQILDATGWNKTRAAEILGVARITLYDKIRNYDLKPPS